MSSVEPADGCSGAAAAAPATPSRRSPQDRDDTVQSQKPCFDYETLGDELDDAQALVAFLHEQVRQPFERPGGDWSGYQAVNHICNGPDWKNVIIRRMAVLTDVPKGKLANFTWITPVCDDSDHVNCGGGYGPSWVAALVNAVGESKFWDSTAIFVQWDDWGGLYDHVPPPFRDYDGVGFRVPLIVISPYAKQDTSRTSSTRRRACCASQRTSSGLGRLAAADKRANSPAQRLLRLFAETARVRSDQGAEGPRLLSQAEERPPHPRLRVEPGCRVYRQM